MTIETIAIKTPIIRDSLRAHMHGVAERSQGIDELAFRTPDSFGSHLSLGLQVMSAIRWNTVLVLTMGTDEAVDRYKADLLDCFENDPKEARKFVRKLVREHNGPHYTTESRDWPNAIEDRFAW